MTCILATTNLIGAKFVTRYNGCLWQSVTLKLRLQQLRVLEKWKLFNICELNCLLSFVIVN